MFERTLLLNTKYMRHVDGERKEERRKGEMKGRRERERKEEKKREVDNGTVTISVRWLSFLIFSSSYSI
jgi:hypothetical protein